MHIYYNLFMKNKRYEEGMLFYPKGNNIQSLLSLETLAMCLQAWTIACKLTYKNFEKNK